MARCPRCDSPIASVVVTGPDAVQLDPCGHRMSERELADLEWDDRRAEVQDAGQGDLYIADGGTDLYCDECGDRLATDAQHGWICLSCGEPRDGPNREDDLKPDGGWEDPDDVSLEDALDGLIDAVNYAETIDEPDLRNRAFDLYQELARVVPRDEWDTHYVGASLEDVLDDMDSDDEPVTDGGEVQEPVDEDDQVLEAVAERGEQYVVWELLGRADEDPMSVQDLRTNDDVEEVDVDSPLEAVVDELVYRVDNLVVDVEHAWHIAEGRVDRARVDVAMDRWGDDDE